MTNTKTCLFCEVEFETIHGLETYCLAHKDLKQNYNYYKHDAHKKGYPVMDHARWFEYHEGLKGMICECQDCGKTFELDRETVKNARYYTRRFCPECKAIKKGEARKRAIANRDAKRKAAKTNKKAYNNAVDYSKAPEEWGLAEYMATLKNNGHGAREYIKKRGYAVDVKYKSELIEHSSVFANAVVHRSSRVN